MHSRLSFLITPALLAAACATLLSSCSGGGGGGRISATASHNPGYGPFDRHGNYVEAWADKPARKHAWASPGPVSPGSPAPVLVSSEGTRAERPPLIARQSPSPTAKPRPAPAPVVRQPSRPSPPPAVQPRPRPTPPKPASTPAARHTVVKGDTLYSLSRRYGSSVSAIQRANGIRGTIIRIGQTLRIPR